jgi:hypothetical protein
MRFLRPSRAFACVAMTWFGVALLTMAIALPASAGSRKKQDSSHSKNVKHSSGGSWGPNGHQPSANSFPQGRSPSDPDGSSNGGADKPGGSGGINTDRDGNNGCGNDTDREDDNNGWCGRKPKQEKQSVELEERFSARGVNEQEKEASQPEIAPAPGVEVQGEHVTRPAAKETTQVLGARLARTGVQLRVLMFIGFSLLPIGFLTYLSARKQLGP